MRVRSWIFAVVLMLAGAGAREVALRAQTPPPAAADNEQALRRDVAHMRVLVGQLERNVGFVDSGQTPLKHQFQLEIEMWNTVIGDMERRLPPKP